MVPDMMPPTRFNSGLMVFQPDADVFADMLVQLPVLGSYDSGDQGFLNRYFKQWYGLPTEHHLPFGYNALSWLSFLYPDAWQQEVLPELRIIHYVGATKPFSNSWAVLPMPLMATFPWWYDVYDTIRTPKIPLDRWVNPHHG